MQGCLSAHGDHRSAGQLASSELHSQEAWWREGSKQPDVKHLGSQGGKKRESTREKCCKCVVYVCETHPHIWSHQCWRCSLVDRCTHSYQQYWCILLRRTHQGWSCTHQYLKQTTQNFLFMTFVWIMDQSFYRCYMILVFKSCLYICAVFLFILIFFIKHFVTLFWKVLNEVYCARVTGWLWGKNGANQMDLKSGKVDSHYFWCALLTCETCKCQEDMI